MAPAVGALVSDVIKGSIALANLVFSSYLLVDSLRNRLQSGSGQLRVRLTRSGLVVLSALACVIIVVSWLNLVDVCTDFRIVNSQGSRGGSSIVPWQAFVSLTTIFLIVLNAMFMNAITDISTAYYRSVRMNNSLRPLSSKLLLGGYIICAIVCIISLIGTLITNDHVWALQKYIGTAILIVVGGGHLLVSLLKLRSLLRHSNQLTLTKVDVKSANNHEVERTRYSSPNSRLESTAGAHIPQSPRVSTSPRCRPQSKPEQLQINSADNAKNERTTSSEVNERTALKASSSRESGMKLRQDNKSPSGIARQPSNWRSSSVASSTPGTPQNYQHRSHRESVPSPTHRRELQGMVSGEDNMTRKLYRMMIITTTTMCALVAFLIFDIYIQFKQENVPASETYNLHAEAYDPRSDARLYIFLLALSVLVYFATPASFTIARCYARRPPLPVVSPAFQGRKASLV